MSDAPDITTEAPLLRIVNGKPTDEEVAVLVTLIAAASGSGDGDPASAEPRNEWGRPEDLFRSQWGGPGSFPNRHF
ncbi:acyl-CoA carboxylase subunit epsilon [Gordonia sp. CPCC 205515]|uniref:acyl-CoA carboxylase subunit epsilon n=1 Tax=Gordonia sp. CPCC 205515 TaxID=3140791 RepID=UPI003AF3A759